MTSPPRDFAKPRHFAGAATVPTYDRSEMKAWPGTLIEARPLRAAVMVLALSGLAAGPAASDSRPRAVLVLFSLRSTAAAVAPLETALRATLEKNFPGPVEFHVEYLDLPDASDVPYGKRLTELLREKYSRRPIDLVVAARSEALNYLLQNREALFPGVPVVFTDVTRRNRGAKPPTRRDRGLLRARGPEDGPRGPRPPPRGAPRRPRRRLLPCRQGVRGLRREARPGQPPRHGDPVARRPAARRAAAAAGGAARRQRGGLRQLPGRLVGPIHGLARRPSPRDARVESPRLRGYESVARSRDRRRRPRRSGPRREGRRPDRPHPPRREALLARADRAAGQPPRVRLAPAPALAHRRGGAPRAASSCFARRRSGRSMAARSWAASPCCSPRRPHRRAARGAAKPRPRRAPACGRGAALPDARRLHPRLGVLAAARRVIRVRDAILPADHGVRGRGVLR